MVCVCPAKCTPHSLGSVSRVATHISPSGRPDSQPVHLHAVPVWSFSHREATGSSVSQKYSSPWSFHLGLGHKASGLSGTDILCLKGDNQLWALRGKKPRGVCMVGMCMGAVSS